MMDSAKDTPAEGGCSGSSPCCASSVDSLPNLSAHYVTGAMQTPVGLIPRISTHLMAQDKVGTWRVRWDIGRMDYKVAPGLYFIGSPNEDSPVLVTANYKLTFDSLRKELAGLNVWIVVLDTKGVNVWCAAGKGTFGTDELIRRIEAVKLSALVRHRTVILPQLGATGVAAHEVARRSGFHVVYGPVRAADIKAFLDAGMKATPAMRAVRFTLADRLVLTPVDLVQWLKPLLIFFGILFLLNAFGIGKFGAVEVVAFVGALVAGCVLTPALLPWIPGRAFSFKGALLGLLWALALPLLVGGPMQIGYLKVLSFLLLLPSVSAYTAMNFTGSSTYTSPSGVNKEMRIAIPIMLIASIAGIICLLVDSFIKVFY